MPSPWLCPTCKRALKELEADVGYYCVFCHLAVTISEAGGYALVLEDDELRQRTRRRVPLHELSGRSSDDP